MLRTTALVGSLFVLGTSVSNAQTTITGQLDLSYRAVSNDAEGQKQNNFRGFGKESQINIANKGKLSNGMDYAAGFSLEFDGNDHGGDGATITTNKNNGDLSGALSGENVYIDLISGNTTITFGADHIQNPDSHAHINPAGVGYITSYTAGVGGLYPTGANSPYNAYGVGIVQTVPGFGKVSANYVPNPTFGSSNIAGTVGPEIGNAGTVTHYDGKPESAYEVGFVGDFGVKGLTVLAFKNAETNAQDEGSSKTKGHRIGASYNFGQITVGLDKVETTGTTGIEVDGKAASITFAATKDFSIGATYAKSDSSSSDNTSDEKIKLISFGYNLGPVAINATIRDVENISGKGPGDTEYLGDSRDAIVRLSTKF